MEITATSTYEQGSHRGDIDADGKGELVVGTYNAYANVKNILGGKTL